MSEVYNHKSNYYGNPVLANNCDEATGKTVYSGIVKQWSDANTLDFDRTSEVAAVGEILDKEQYSAFLSASAGNTILHNPEQPEDHHYDSSIEVRTIPYTKVQYSVEGKEYEMYVMGNNKVACYENVPQELHLFAIDDDDDQTKYEKTLKKRVKAMAKLAAYIFQCDGKSQEESRLLNCTINEMNLSEKQTEKFRKKLEKYNSSMPYEKLEKEISCLFISKKSLAFAWQCMAVDKTVSPQEQELFDRLYSSFSSYSSNDTEKEQIKSMASRFAKIDDWNIIKNYADIPDDVELSYPSRLSAIILGVLIVAGVACVAWLLT